MSSRAVRLKQARKLAGLKQTEVALKLNKSVSTVKSWEQEGGSNPGSLDDVSRICELYGISIDYFITGADYQCAFSEDDLQLLVKLRALKPRAMAIIEDLIDELSE